MTEPGVPVPARGGAGPDDETGGPPGAEPVGSAQPRAADGLPDGPAAPEAEPGAGHGPGGVRPHVPRPSWGMAGVALGVIVVDQITKWWAQRELADGSTVHVVGSLLRFELTYNSGMAFSRGTGLGPVIGVVAIVVIVILLASLRRESSRLARGALAAVIGGAVGNLLDRLFRAGDGFMGGSVVDFIRLPHWPYFNVADMGVTLGGVALVLGAWWSGRAGGRDAAPRS